MNRRSNLLFLIPLSAALVAYFITQQLIYTAIAFVFGYLLMEGLRFKLLPPHLHRAAQRYQKGDLNGALALTEKAIEASPQRWESHYLQALIQFNNADLKGAERAAEKAIELKSDEAPSHLILGQILFAQGLYERARSAFHEALRSGGKSGIYQYYSAVAAYRLSDCAEAVPRLELALRLGVDNPQLLLLTKYYLAVCLQEAGEQEAANGYFKQLSRHAKELDSLRQDLHIVPDFPERSALSQDVQGIARHMPADNSGERSGS